MAKVLLGAMNSEGGLNRKRLGTYEAVISYDLWSYGVVLYHLVTGRPLWLTNQNDDIAHEGDLEQLSEWTRKSLNTGARQVRNPTKAQETALHLICQLLGPDPKQRLEHVK